MAARTKPPFRADHVGSLLRPPELLQARDDHAAGRIDDDQLRAAEDEAIREVVQMQKDVGLQDATDGEFRRNSWHMDFIFQLGGVTVAEGESLHVHFRDEQGEYDYAPPAMRVADKVTLRDTIFGDAFSFLRDTVDGSTAKLTIPSPSMVHYRGGNSSIDHDVYPDLDEQYIANINRALAGRPDDLAVTTHMCRGNNQSMWAAEGGYDFVAEALFTGLEVDGFFLEYDDERSGTFEPLRFVPKGKLVVLGLVTTKRPTLEDKDVLKRRMEEASRYVELDQLCLSPQCGFSSTVEGNKLTRDDQAAKLRLVVETAEEVWGS